MSLIVTRTNRWQLIRLIAVFSCFALVLPAVFCQKKWTGRFSERWDNPLNWQPAGVPLATDDVILDNSLFSFNYRVFLPDQLTGIHSLLIEPGPGNRIELNLPATNTASPALQVYKNGNSIVIRRGGVFRNSSGLNSGQSLLLNGLLCIYNEGFYVHNSRSAHAADIVAKLSTGAGTEKGVFEYDVPGGSYPLSLSNRAYGTLLLSSTASGGTQTYNASGTNQVVINGDLKINNGVQFNVDLTKEMIINGDYLQPGGVFNIASQNNNNVVIIRGDITQDNAGLVTESAAGLPVFELAGTAQQLVRFAGRFSNSVTLRINNPDGILLLGHLSISFKLQLVKGKVKSSASVFITVPDNCTVSGGSADSFIEGPLRKVGDDDFEFPVGKESDYAPVKISGNGGHVTDEFTASYFLANPASVYGALFENPPVVRISSLEYWMIERSAGASSRKISLSVGTYSQATALEYLVVVMWDKQGAIWRNAGNSFYSGITTGSITSNELNDFGTFTLASTVATQNPLPLKTLNFIADVKAGFIDLQWEPGDKITCEYYEVEKSSDGKQYQYLARLDGHQRTRKYQFRYARGEEGDMFLRLKLITKLGGVFYSEPLKISLGSFNIIKIYPVPVRSELNLEVTTSFSGTLEILIRDYAGRILKRFTKYYAKGKNVIKLHVDDLSKGNYFIQVKDHNQIEKSCVFFKQ